VADDIEDYEAGKIRLFCIVFNNDFKGAGDGAGGANKLAGVTIIGTMAATYISDDFNFIIFHYQNTAFTCANA
jgi:hypothetical protein